VAQRGFARYSFDPQVRQLAYARLQSTVGRSWLDSVQVTASFHRSGETRVRQTAGSPVTITEHDVVDTWGWTLQGHSRPRGFAVVWGAEGYHDEVRSSRRDVDAATGLTREPRGLYPDGAAARSLAAFADGRWERGRWVAEGGLRYTRHRVMAADPGFGDLDVEPSAVVGRAAASFEWTPGHRVVASVEQGFRAPNVDDLSTLGLFSFGVEVPSPALKPEHAVSFEVGWKARTTRLAAGVSAFRTELRDLIERVPDRYQGAEFLEGQRVYRRANVGRAHVQGAEADLQWTVSPRLLALGHLTYTYGRVDTTGDPMRRIPPLNGGAALRWTATERLSLEGSLRFAARQDRLAPGDRADHRINPLGTPGWQVVVARAAWTPHRRITLRGGIDNAFDEAYRVHGSGIDGQGRTLWVSTQARF
jgi:outer membrane receptor protein involved in Fe transport